MNNWNEDKEQKAIEHQALLAIMSNLEEDAENVLFAKERYQVTM